MKRKIQKKPFLVTLPPDLLLALNKNAKDAGLTRNAFIREAIVEKFKRMERERFIESLDRDPKTKN